MSFIESILYGLVSGFSEFSPVSSRTHQSLLKFLFGIAEPLTVIDMMAHLGMLFALFFSCRSLFSRLKRDKSFMQHSRRNKYRQIPAGIYDIRVMRTASIPLALMMILSRLFFKKEAGIITLAVCMILNGIILLASDYIRQGNKRANCFSALDSVGLGIFSGLSCLPGISRVGAGLSFSVYRGADKSAGYTWTLLLSVPALIFMLIFDCFGLITYGLGTINFVQILHALLVFIFSFIGSCSAISFMRYIINNIRLSCFAFYCWGVSLFSFIIYLLI